MEDRAHPLVIAAEEGRCAVNGRRLSVFAAGLVTLAACAQGPGAAAPAGTAPATASRSTSSPPASANPSTSAREPTAAATVTRTNGAALPKVVVHKSPSCGCCALWVKHMREAGFSVDVRNTDNLEPVKKRLGVPLGEGSCHTAQVGTLVVEGHVPAGDIKRLLATNDGAKGLVLPGMPAGSPGMEMPDGRVQRYTVEKINADGSTSPFATHGE